MSRSSRWTPALVLSDLVAFNASFALAWWLRFSVLRGHGPSSLATYGRLLMFGNVIVFVMFLLAGLYREKRTLFDADEFWNIARGLVFSGIILTSATYLTRGFDYSRLMLLFTFGSSLAVATGFRVIIRKAQGKGRSNSRNQENTLIVGSGTVAESLCRKIRESPWLGYRVMGSVDRLAIPQIREAVERHDVRTVFLVSSQFPEEEIIETITKFPSVTFKIVPNLLHVVTGPVRFDEFSDIPLIHFRGRSGERYEREQRLFDIVFSAFVLIVFSPVLLLIAALSKLTSKGPVIFTQLRVGKNRQCFRVYKFRTMVDDAEVLKPQIQNEIGGPLFKVERDPRVTPLGRVLRRTCLDEMPQFVNVLKGDMSIVGPRPHLPEEMDEFEGWKADRFAVKPGITGMWQISGRHDLHFDKAVMLDLYYIKHRSLLLDLEIILKTIPTIVFSRGRW